MNLIKPLVIITIGLIVTGGILVPAVTEMSEDRDTLEVVVLGGQSNIAYVLDYMDLSTVNSDFGAPAADCYYFGKNVPVRLNMPLGSCELHSMYSNGAWIIGGEEVGIAYTIANKTQNDVLVINAAIPAYSVSQFEPGTTGGDHIKHVIEAALSEIPSSYSITKCGWVWCQGESDKTTSVNDYVASFDKVAGLFNDFGFTTCYMVQTRPVDSGNARLSATAPGKHSHKNAIRA